MSRRSLFWGARAAAVALAVALTPAVAQSQVVQDEFGGYHSPQHFAFELRFGPYSPDIDSEFGGSRAPHKEFFGDKNRLMSQIEFDYQILRHVGSLGIGLGAGYFTESGKNPTAAGILSEDRSTLRLFPFSLSAVYRFDLPYERAKIPLVPYGKVGLDYVMWSIRNGNGEIPDDPAGGRAAGGTWGWHAAVGLSFILDFLDPVSAQQFDVEMGVNHTHLFAELGTWKVDGLGMANKLHVGDTTWTGGLLFEF